MFVYSEYFYQRGFNILRGDITRDIIIYYFSGVTHDNRDFQNNTIIQTIFFFLNSCFKLKNNNI